jgi:twitching motility protein PilT
MQSFDQSIFSLCERGLVTVEEALRWASNVDEFKLRIQGISSGSELTRAHLAEKKAAGGPAKITRFGG